MRQLGDMLVWLGLIVVVAAVVYFTPRIANYVAVGAARPWTRKQDFARDGLPALVTLMRLPEKRLEILEPLGQCSRGTRPQDGLRGEAG